MSYRYYDYITTPYYSYTPRLSRYLTYTSYGGYPWDYHYSYETTTKRHSPSYYPYYSFYSPRWYSPYSSSTTSTRIGPYGSRYLTWYY